MSKKDLKPTGNWLKFDCIQQSDPEYFFNEELGDVNNPCYRLVLTHAFCKYLDEYYFRERHIDDEEIERQMDTLKLYYENIHRVEKSFYWEHFIEIIPIRGSQLHSGRGCVLVDRTGGTFPLVMYPPKHGKGLRSHAFGYAIRDLVERWRDILYIQKENPEDIDPVTDWMNFKMIILNLFDYPDGKKKAS